MPMTAEQVLEAVGPGRRRDPFDHGCLPGRGSRAPDWSSTITTTRARRAEAETVASLRRAGINAAGQVGDRNPSHAVEDALALFPAGTVVVVARALEADVYREHLDADEFQRERGVALHGSDAVARLAGGADACPSQRRHGLGLGAVRACAVVIVDDRPAPWSPSSQTSMIERVSSPAGADRLERPPPSSAWC